MQHGQRLLPVLLVDQNVPVGNDVVDGANVRTERNAAIHAARALAGGLLVGQRPGEFLPVTSPLQWGDREDGLEGKGGSRRVELGGGRSINKKKTNKTKN